MAVAPIRQITAIASDEISGMYRFVTPLRSMLERRWISGNVLTGTDSRIELAPGSTIMTQRQIALAPAVIAVAKQHGCRLVHDLDDLLWSIPSDNPNVGAFTPELVSAMDAQMRTADVITVSTEPLAEVVRRRGLEAVVLPNVLDPRDWTVQPRRAQRTRIRVGWYGQRHVHVADLTLLDEVITALSDEVDFVFLGDFPQALAGSTLRVEAHLPVPLSLFPAMLAALDLDLVLAPLADNEFNACKSNLRLLQSGMLGYPVIASDTPSHQHLPVHRVASRPSLWIDAIRERADDRTALRAEGEELRRAVDEHFSIETWVERYHASWTGQSAPVVLHV